MLSAAKTFLETIFLFKLVNDLCTLMTRKGKERSIRSRGQQKCANCNVKCINQLSFTDGLPEWTNQTNYLHVEDSQDVYMRSVLVDEPNSIDSGREEGSERTDQHEVEVKPFVTNPPTSTVRSSNRRKSTRNKDFVTVLEALLKVFDLHWQCQSDVLKLAKSQKSKLRLCSSCAVCLSQVYDGLVRFTKQTLNDKSKSFLHPVVFSKSPDIKKEYSNEIDDEEAIDEDRSVSSDIEMLLSSAAEFDSKLLSSTVVIEKDIKLELTGLQQAEDDSDDSDFKPARRREKRGSSTRSVQCKRKRLRQAVSAHYTCAEGSCDFETENYENYTDHLLNIHGIEKNDDDNEAPNSDESHSCIVCRLKFVTNEELQSHCSAKHVPSIRVRSHSCTDCSKSFITKHDLKNHAATHVISSLFSCDQCPFKTRRQQELDRHLKLVHLQEKNYFCGECSKGFALKWQLIDHERLHNAERNYSCAYPGCGKTFKTPSNLRQHSELHRGSKYVCDICGQSYSRKAYLRLHMNGTHLMLPLPPSLKRDKRKRSTAASKAPRSKAAKRDSKTKNLEKIILRETKILEEIVVTNDTTNADEESTQDQEQEQILGYEPKGEYITNPALEAPHETQFHVQLELDPNPVERGDSIILAQDGRDLSTIDQSTFALADGQQIICYPVGMNIISTEGGSTFYITTAPQPTQQQHPGVEESEPTPITVFSTFTDFLSSQQ